MEQPSQSVAISHARPTDSLGIVKVIQDTWLSTYPNSDYDITTEDIKERFANRTDKERAQRLINRLKNPSINAWVARSGDKIVGVCMVEKQSDRNYVGATYVLKDFQDMRLGRQLVEPALKWLGSDKEVWLGVVPYNHGAIKFFESFGFRKTGKQVKHDEPTFPSGKELPEIEMVK